jgi:hypothetical protein
MFEGLGPGLDATGKIDGAAELQGLGPGGEFGDCMGLSDCLDQLSFYKNWFLALAHKNWFLKKTR